MIKRSDIKVTRGLKPEEDSEFPHVYTATYNTTYVIRTKLNADHFEEEVVDCLLGDIYEELDDLIHKEFERVLYVESPHTSQKGLRKLKDEIDKILDGESE